MSTATKPKKEKDDTAPRRCPYCRHLMADCDHGNCRVCLVLVLRESPCYPAKRRAA